MARAASPLSPIPSDPPGCAPCAFSRDIRTYSRRCTVGAALRRRTKTHRALWTRRFDVLGGGEDGMHTRKVRRGRLPQLTWRSRSGILASLGLIVVALAAWGGSSHKSASSSSSTSAGPLASIASSSGSKTLTIAIGQDFGTLDIRGLGSASSFSVLREITQPLVEFDATGHYIPALATSWSRSARPSFSSVFATMCASATAIRSRHRT